MNITTEQLTKVYRGGRRALDAVDLHIDQGTVGLLGANGAGKTTLLRILTGVLRPTSGRVLVGGNDLSTTAGLTAAKRQLGYLPQELNLYPDLTAREFLDYIAVLKGMHSKQERRRQVEEHLDAVGLRERGSERLAAFSGGMRRRVGIAQALLGNPSVLIVDEPTAGLDPHERMRFRALLAGLGGSRTVLLSSHLLDDVAQTCRHVAVIAAGRLVFHGSTGALAGQAAGCTYVVRGHGPGGLPPADAQVVSAVTTPAGDAEYRVVTATPPPGGRPVEPSLEDGYAALLAADTAGRGVSTRDRNRDGRNEVTER
ncbi:ABC transporter ATP-binding protein [Streptomyces candidus]|uniref:ABC-type multidrug transport system ATPase subunit n=1 Tax=Streptomyces candidus TaxID=67283 RepID=A0A7X0HF22_9ACTN|nr:ATP-binding cassette domain-containing protein [Streptomyces candidus]MBB6435127.1 ABC-type multidrug transport system ATPase subunit [Streptomyces candidus]GHH40759.1 ABC transporter ATP-binding protein [Streptomyces candidus]